MSVTSDLEAREFSLTTGDGATYAFTGTRLGFGTSRRRSHINHPPGESPPPGVRCSGCRWTDTTIFRRADEDFDSDSDSIVGTDADSGRRARYVVHIVGRSVVPGESDRIRIAWAQDADAVLDCMLITRPKRIARLGGDPTELELPQPNAHALEEAAECDRTIAAALRGWVESNDD